MCRLSCNLAALTTLPPSYADCLAIWQPEPAGTLRACNGIVYCMWFGVILSSCNYKYFIIVLHSLNSKDAPVTHRHIRVAFDCDGLELYRYVNLLGCGNVRSR